jgi:hypothetical protein
MMMKRYKINPCNCPVRQPDTGMAYCKPCVTIEETDEDCGWVMSRDASELERLVKSLNKEIERLKTKHDSLPLLYTDVYLAGKKYEVVRLGAKDAPAISGDEPNTPCVKVTITLLPKT